MPVLLVFNSKAQISWQRPNYALEHFSQFTSEYYDGLNCGLQVIAFSDLRAKKLRFYQPTLTYNRLSKTHTL